MTGTDDGTRAAPYSIDAEQALLGAIFVNNAAHDRVSDFLEASHFYDPLHQRIYETASKLIALGTRADPITLKTFFQNVEPIDAGTTVPQYLGRLAARATTITNAQSYGRIVHDLATRRQLIVIAEDMANAAYNSPVDFSPNEQIEEAEARLFSLAEHGERRGGIDTATYADMANKSVQDAHHGRRRGLSFRLKDLDAKLGGLNAPDLVILAGRPSMGKTALATNLAHDLARNGTPVGFFSLEMSGEQIITRTITERAGLSFERATQGKLDDDEMCRFGEAAAEVSALPLFIEESPGISIAQLCSRARRKRRTHKIGALFVDYLQLMNGRGSASKSENRVQEISNITSGLKQLALELKIPVIALSQLSRAPESRENKRPQLSDLRDSGSIEQDADVVMFVYREDYYLERLRPSESDASFPDWTAKISEAAGKAEVVVGKNRHGAVGIVPLQFDASVMRFSNLARNHRLQRPDEPRPPAVKVFNA